MERKNKEINERNAVIHSLIEIGILLTGFSLLIIYGITGNIVFLHFSNYLCALILFILACVFLFFGMSFGFKTYAEIDGEFDFGIMIALSIYLILNLLL